jgi:hypothetical protein
MPKIKPGKYHHFKGKDYEIIGVGHHSETLEELVIYRALYDSAEFGKNALWARPIESFIDPVEKNGKKIPRFKFIDKK